MGVKVSLPQLQNELPELLDEVVRTGEEYVVQRNGKDWAVLVSARQWRLRTVGQRLDALGPAYRFPRKKQQRTEALLAHKTRRSLTPAEDRELKALLYECDTILLRRAAALEHVR